MSPARTTARRDAGRGDRRLLPLLALPFLFIALLSTPGCHRQQAPEKTAEAVLLGPEDVARASLEEIGTGPELSGTLVASTQSTIRAQIGGTVSEVHARQGEPVNEGETLARIRNESVGDALQSAQAAVSNARNALQTAQTELNRQQKLFDAGIVAKSVLDQARQNVSAARAALEQTQSQAASARQQAGYTDVRSPIRGVVSEKQVSEGDVVQGGAALFVVVDPSSLQLEASIPTDQLGALSVGSPVEFSVTGYPDRKFNGSVARINPVADPSTQQVRVYASVPNRGNVLVSGLHAEGRVRAGTHQALVVPASAIDRSLQKPAVMKVVNGEVRRTEVKLGAKDEAEDQVEVLQGLQSGDVVLVGAAQDLTPGTRVEVSDGAEPTA